MGSPGAIVTQPTLEVVDALIPVFPLTPTFTLNRSSPDCALIDALAPIPSNAVTLALAMFTAVPVLADAEAVADTSTAEI